MASRPSGLLLLRVRQGGTPPRTGKRLRAPRGHNSRIRTLHGIHPERGASGRRRARRPRGRSVHVCVDGRTNTTNRYGSVLTYACRRTGPREGAYVFVRMYVCMRRLRACVSWCNPAVHRAYVHTCVCGAASGYSSLPGHASGCTHIHSHNAACAPPWTAREA